MSQLVSLEPSDVAINDRDEPAQKEVFWKNDSLLGYYRNYLLKLANQKIDQDVSVKVPASDIVQNTLTLAPYRKDIQP
ncbi:MAG: hypothetical protein KDA65_07765, partial [Planctomycetaceae bacterium]|nr:hypothetical protein [Planctomycetaceae bacterium]